MNLYSDIPFVEVMIGLFAVGEVLYLILLVLNLPLAPVFAQILRVPYGYLYPLILLTSFVGAYSTKTPDDQASRR